MVLIFSVAGDIGFFLFFNHFKYRMISQFSIVCFAYFDMRIECFQIILV